jgi:hypothetical protein
LIGIRFIASVECNAHDIYKEKVLQANEEDTVRTTLFGNGSPNAWHRKSSLFATEQIASPTGTRLLLSCAQLPRGHQGDVYLTAAEDSRQSDIKCLATTNLIEGPHSGVRKRARHVCRWRMWTWSSAGRLPPGVLTEKNFRRIDGHKEL